MANCGISKYDELPARVGPFFTGIDVDYLRYRLHACDNPSWLRRRYPFLAWFLQPSVSEVSRSKIIAKLDEARDRFDKSTLV